MSLAEQTAVKEFTDFINLSGAKLIKVEDVTLQLEEEDGDMNYWIVEAVVEYSHGEFHEEWHKHEHDPDNEWDCTYSEPDGF